MSPLQLVRSALTTLLLFWAVSFLSASHAADVPFTHQIIASNNPTSYTATGLTFDTSTGKSLPISIE